MLEPDSDQMDTDPKDWFIVPPYPRRPRGSWRPSPLPSPDKFFFLPSANLLTFLVIKTLDPDLDRCIQPKMLDPDPDKTDTDPTHGFIVYFFCISPSLPKEATRMLLKFLAIKTVDLDLDRYSVPYQMDTNPKHRFFILFFIFLLVPSYPRRRRGCWRRGPLPPPAQQFCPQPQPRTPPPHSWSTGVNEMQGHCARLNE
jgi:hypothetical protein